MSAEFDVHVRQRGQGPAVLLVHSAGSFGGQWRGLCERLGDGHRWVMPDLYGHGGSPPWPGDPQDPSRVFSLNDEADALAKVLDSVPTPVHVVGHSYGGAACVQLALMHPHRVRTLTVHEPTLFRVLLDAGRERDWEQVYEPTMKMLALTEAGQPAAAAERFLDYLMGAGAWQLQTEEQRAILTALMPVTIARECRAQFLDPTLRLNAYARLEMPTTVVVGERSPPSVVAASEVLAEAIGSARLVRLAKAGHMAPITHPSEFEAVVREVLAAGS